MPRTAPYVVSIRPGELVRRGVPVEIRTTSVVNPDSVRGVKVAGQRVAVSLGDDRKSISVDTSGLPTGTYSLLIEELLNNAHVDVEQGYQRAGIRDVLHQNSLAGFLEGLVAHLRERHR